MARPPADSGAGVWACRARISPSYRAKLVICCPAGPSLRVCTTFGLVADSVYVYCRSGVAEAGRLFCHTAVSRPSGSYCAVVVFWFTSDTVVGRPLPGSRVVVDVHFIGLVTVTAVTGPPAAGV